VECFVVVVLLLGELLLDEAGALLPAFDEVLDFLLLPQPATPAAARATTARSAGARYLKVVVITGGYARRTATDRIA
jgi:hypothetical protein